MDESSSTASVLGVVGATASAVYLLVACLANGAALARLVSVYRSRKGGGGVEGVAPAGPWARILSKPMSRITKPWHVYGAGLVFSLGFDTSSQIGIMVLTGAAAADGNLGWSLMAVPMMFTAAMSLGDGLNGAVMGRIYESAQPLTRLRANMALTTIGVIAAAAVTVTVGSSVLTDLGIGGALPARVAEIDTTWAGVALVVVLLVGAAVTIGQRPRRPADVS